MEPAADQPDELMILAMQAKELELAGMDERSAMLSVYLKELRYSWTRAAEMTKALQDMGEKVALHPDVEQVVALLKALEWGAIYSDLSRRLCRICGGFEADGHKPDCALNAALLKFPLPERAT